MLPTPLNPSSLSVLKRLLFVAMFIAPVMSLMVNNAHAEKFQLEPWPSKLRTPPLKLTSLDGKPWDATQLQGKVVLLNYWASWCEPCVNEFPALASLANGNDAGKGLVVIGINFKESGATIRDFQARHGSGFPVYVDRSGQSFSQWTKGVLPTSILIGRDGRARWRISGELDISDARFSKVLKQLLQEGAADHEPAKIIEK